MFESKINRGRANGYAPLDGSGKVPLDKLPPIQSTIDTGSFATTGSNTFTGTQTISDIYDTSLTIGELNFIGGPSFGLRVSGSDGAPLFLTSDVTSLIGAITNPTNISDDASFFANQLISFPISDGPTAGILVQKSGSFQSNWVFDYDGKSYFPSDINIGYNSLGSGLTSGSLNVNKGNINVSGSVYVSSSLVVSSTFVNNGTIDALNSDLIIDGGDIILSGSFAQQVNYSPLGSGSWETQPIGEITELNITKDIHVLDMEGSESNVYWFLPDGLYDGQVVRLALKSNATSNPNFVRVYMNNLRTYDGTIQSNTNWSPFLCGEGQGPCRSLATAVYIAGAWNIDTDWWDM